MLLHPAAVTAILCVAATAVAQSYAPCVPGNGTGPDADGKYHLQAEGIRAYFIPYGASLSNLFINDTHGVERDVVMGFDNATYYSIDRQHPHLNGVPGTSLIVLGSSIANSSANQTQEDTQIVLRTRHLPSAALRLTLSPMRM